MIPEKYREKIYTEEYWKNNLRNFTYLSIDLDRSTKTHYYYNVVCKCGLEMSIRHEKLLQDRGCKKCYANTRKNTLTEKQLLSLQKALYNQYKFKGEERNYSFMLSFNEFINLIYKNCHYCNDFPNNVFKRGNKSMKYTGIDRKNNNIGYELDNCVSCCAECNWMKGTMNESSFLNKITKILKKFEI